MNPARQAGIERGLPVEVPALTVNRVCGSGAQAIATAAPEIWARPDRLRHRRRHGEHGPRAVPAAARALGLPHGRRARCSTACCATASTTPSRGKHSGWHTEDLVLKHRSRRDDQDRWALRSQQRFSAAQAAGKFDAEIAAVEVPDRKGPAAFAKDEHNRPDTTAEIAGQAQAGLPQGGHHHRRQCAGPELRGARRWSWPSAPGPRRTASSRWPAW